MIPGLVLLWTAVLGGASPSPPRLRLSFQGRRTWYAGKPSSGWAGKGPNVGRGHCICCYTCVYHLTQFGLRTLSGHLQLTLSWPQSPPSLPTFSPCCPRKTTSVPMATDPASVPSLTPREVEEKGPLEPPSHTPYIEAWSLGSGITLSLGWWQRTLSLTWGVGFQLSLHVWPPPEPWPPSVPAWRHCLSKHAQGAQPSFPWGWGGGCTAHP